MKDKLLVGSNISEYLIDKYGAERDSEYIFIIDNPVNTSEGNFNSTADYLEERGVDTKRITPVRDEGDDMITTINPDPKGEVRNVVMTPCEYKFMWFQLFALLAVGVLGLLLLLK